MQVRTTTRSPFQEILEWGATLPLWQQEALRHVLMSTAKPSPATLAELADHCLAEHDGATLAISPLSGADLPIAASAGEPVTLLGFGLPDNVNALRSDQWINVGPSLTVIFGNNAAGKSGYGRILKRAFRARIVDDLHPNVRAETFNADAQGATFEFKKGSDAQPYRVAWTTKTRPSDNEFSRFAVMDSKCGHAYVTNNELQLAPQGLDVVPRFIEVLDTVKSELRERRSKLPSAKTFLDGVDGETEIARFVGKVSATSEWEDVRSRIEFSDAKTLRLAEARTNAAELRAKSPRQIRSRLQGELKAANTIRIAVKKRHVALSLEGIEKVGAARAQRAGAADAAKTAQKLSQDQQLVKEVGSDPWAELVRAAGRFVSSTEASSGGLALDGRCPLCLEALSPNALNRVERYWAFITDTASDLQTQAEAGLSSVLDELKQLQPARDAQLEALAESLADYDDQLPVAVATFVDLAASTSKDVLEKPEAAAKAIDGTPLLAALDAIIGKIDARMLGTPHDDDGAAAVDSLDKEIRELQCSATLHARSEDIRSYIGRLREMNRLDAAQATIKSTAATKKSNELYEAHLTNAYRLAVETELKNLSFARHSPVLLQDGPKGKVKLILLANPKYRTVTAEQIFSEGERTAIAIASFFAELSLDDTQLGLIFDDPISSLDHRVRERVALRLVEESLRRQVVVFTHDLVFLTELNRIAIDKAVPVSTCELSSTSTVVGVVSDMPPWDALKVGKRMSILEALLKEAEDHDESGKPDDLARVLHHFYGLLRSTWERFIEEKLFAGSIQRFDRHIKANSLYDAVLDPELVDTVVKQINSVSGRIEAHDHSAAMNTPPATLAEAAADLESLRVANIDHKALAKRTR